MASLLYECVQIPGVQIALRIFRQTYLSAGFQRLISFSDEVRLKLISLDENYFELRMIDRFMDFPLCVIELYVPIICPYV